MNKSLMMATAAVAGMALGTGFALSQPDRYAQGGEIVARKVTTNALSSGASGSMSGSTRLTSSKTPDNIATTDTLTSTSGSVSGSEISYEPDTTHTGSIAPSTGSRANNDFAHSEDVSVQIKPLTGKVVFPTVQIDQFTVDQMLSALEEAIQKPSTSVESEEPTSPDAASFTNRDTGNPSP